MKPPSAQQMLVITTILLAGCGGLSTPEGDWTEDVAHDFTTPEGAMLSLADAQKSGDVDAAVQCRDFQTEASIMLASLENDMSDEADLVAQTAEVLELAYRQEVKQVGFPDYSAPVKIVYRKFPVDGHEDRYRITERFVFRDGSMSVGEYIAVHTDDDWRIVSPLPSE